MTDLAPVAYFAYKRPWTTLQSLYTLSRCPEAKNTELTIFCDGPRDPANEKDCQLVREIARSRDWCGKVNVIERAGNCGLSKSIIGAVHDFCDSHGRVIVLEDDLLVSRGFLTYMNQALVTFQDAEQVAQVSGHQFSLGLPPGQWDFLPLTTSWGWATWKRAWAHFQAHPDITPLRSRNMRRDFDQNATYPYSAMLIDQHRGRIDSWAIRWYWSAFRRSMLTLYPSRTLISNVGFGANATNTRRVASHDVSSEWTIDTGPPEPFTTTRTMSNPTWLAAWRQAARGSLPEWSFRYGRAILSLTREVFQTDSTL
jgi:hypothetical protein